MERISVAYDRYFTQLCDSFNKGGALLVSVDDEGRPNTMTIGWGQLGVIWGRWVFTVLVRPSRYTYGCINTTGDFTVNVPFPEQAEALAFCGSKSGRDYDKFAECNLTAAAAQSDGLRSPYIAECGLAYECKTLSFNDLIPAQTDAAVCDGCYPKGDFHRLYFGGVVAAHCSADFAQRFGK